MARVVLALAALLALAAAAPILPSLNERNACTKPDRPPTYVDEVYYADVHAAEDAREMRAALALLLSNGTLSHSYSCVWDMCEEADEDPSNPDNVILVYTGESWPKSQRDTGSSTTGWNREHVWPKSKGFPDEGDVPYTDGHHLFAAEKRVNSMRSNKDYKDGGDAVCLLPYKNDINDCDVITYTTSSTWEVPDDYKGQLARVIFYMEVRNQGQDNDTPTLEVIDESTGSIPYFGWLCTLLEWHHDFPVTEREMFRNNAIYSWQYNRNVFVDHPEWVDELWSC